MANKISWTEESWNPITGCTQHSQGCANCYAKKIALIHQKQGTKGYENGFSVNLREDRLNIPWRWGKPTLIFVCDMSDLFHKDVPFEFIDKVIEVIKSTPWHTYQLLTKRAERMAEYFSTRAIPSNVWLGVTVENESVKYRIDILRTLDAPIRFLSCEPLIGDLGELNLDNIDFVIVGGENSDKARPMKEEWVLHIKEQAEKQGALFHFKQWGTYGQDGIKRNVELNGYKLQGKTYRAIPNVNRHTLFG